MSLLIVAITALAINYLMIPTWTQVSASQQKYQSQLALVETLRTDYADIDSYRKEEKQLSTDLEGLRKVLPNYFSEEEIVAALNDHAASSGLQVLGISFGGTTVNTQEEFLSGLKLASTTKPAPAAASSTADSPSADTESTPKDSANYIQSERVSVSYTGSYENVINFLSAYESQTRQVYFQAVTLSRADNGAVNGALTMLVFSSLNKAALEPGADYPGYEFAAPAAPGKGDPFASFASYAGGTGSASPTLATPDFYVILNTYDDNSDKILVGKYPVSGAQVSADGNQTASATLTLNKSGSRCSYKYTLGQESHSGSFTLADGDSSLSVSILSRARKSSMDNVGIKLNVQNNTDLPVIIAVKNDDTANPRFQLGTTSGSVQVVR